jgi:hypothetical protein
MNISQAVLLWKRKRVKGGKAAAQQSRPLMKQSRAFDVADMPLAAINVLLMQKRPNVCF